MVKVKIFEVSTSKRDLSEVTIKSTIIDGNDPTPRTDKEYVMISFEEYEKLAGKKIKIIEPFPKKQGRRKGMTTNES